MLLRESIVDAFVAELGTINSATTPPNNTVAFTNAIQTVERVLRDHADVAPADLPWIGVGPTTLADELYDYAPPSACAYGTLPIDLLALIPASKGDPATVAASTWIDDIIRCLFAKPRLAIDGVKEVRLRGTRTDEIAPNTRESRGDLVWIIQRWEVEYRIQLRR